MVLQAKVARGGLTEVFKSAELGSGHALVPILGTFDILDIFGAVHPLNTLLGSDENTQRIPLTGWLGRVDHGLGLVELVEPTRLLGIVPFDVVLDLNLSAGLPGIGFSLGNMKHEPRIATDGNTVINGEFEGLILLLGDDVANATFRECQRAVLYLPGILDALGFVVTKVLGRFPVKKKGPTLFLFGIAEFVGEMMIGRERQGHEEKWEK